VACLAVLLKNPDDLIIKRDVVAPGKPCACAEQQQRK
jgi:hypothetical protein